MSRQQSSQNHGYSADPRADRMRLALRDRLTGPARYSHYGKQAVAVSGILHPTLKVRAALT